MGLPSCLSKSVSGNLIGVVVREGTGEIVKSPFLIVGRVLHTPLAPDQMIYGDEKGRFAITVTAGNYNVQVSSKEAGPFLMWPEVVPVEGNKTTIRAFAIPADY